MFDKINLADSLLEGMANSIGIKPYLCTRIKHKSSPCMVCHINCPTEAIKVGDVGSTIFLDRQKCTGCGICINLCPTETYYLRHSGFNEFINNCLKHIDNKGELQIYCSQSENNKASIGATIDCIGLFNHVYLLLLYTKGARKIIFNHGDCQECDSKHGNTILSKEIDLLKELSGVFEYLDGFSCQMTNNNTIIDFPKSFPIERPTEQVKKNPTLDRRGLFSFFTNNIKNTALQSAAIITPQKLPPTTEISFNQAVPERRKLFLDCIMKLGNILSRQVATSRMFNNISIDEGCIYCGMCAKFCNTGALAINNDKSELTFNPSKCVSCKLCQKACYHNKLHYKDTLDLKDFFNDISLIKKG